MNHAKGKKGQDNIEWDIVGGYAVGGNTNDMFEVLICGIEEVKVKSESGSGSVKRSI